ncbi:MAG: hypothetical protein HGA33_06745 [Candidatus Moranbacteria bacterium]|nr:hypothetical protein [Candidatus Moranbacteria bacterium]
MNSSDIFNFGLLIGGSDRIVALLGIESLPEEDQLVLVGRFSDIVLKRVLLRVPDENVEDVKRALLSDGGNLEAFITALEASIPDFDRCLEEELEKTVADFLA